MTGTYSFIANIYYKNNHRAGMPHAFHRSIQTVSFGLQPMYL